MNRYSSLGAQLAIAKGHRSFSFINIVLRPLATFVYNYFFRLGFLDGREGLLLHLYHAGYVSWKYAKAWELSRNAAEVTPSDTDRPVVLVASSVLPTGARFPIITRERWGPHAAEKPPKPQVAESPIADVFENRHPSAAERTWAEKTLAPTLEKAPEQPIGAPTGVNLDERGTPVSRRFPASRFAGSTHRPISRRLD